MHVLILNNLLQTKQNITTLWYITVNCNCVKC